MNTSAWITLGTIAMIIIALVNKRKYGPDLVMAGGLVILMITGVVGFEAGTEGFSGRPLLMLAGLFIIAAALQETDGIRPLVFRKSTTDYMGQQK